MGKDTPAGLDPMGHFRAALEAMYFTKQSELVKAERKYLELPNTAGKDQVMTLRGMLSGVRLALDELQAIHLDSQIQRLDL